MKNVLVFASIIVLAGLFAGCGKTPDGWYPIEGGYINLKNVKVITTHANLRPDTSLLSVIAGPITKNSINKAKEEIRKNHKNLTRFEGSAYIEFDGFKVMLDSLPEFESYKDILKLLDTWLEAVESLKVPAI